MLRGLVCEVDPSELGEIQAAAVDPCFGVHFLVDARFLPSSPQILSHSQVIELQAKANVNSHLTPWATKTKE